MTTESNATALERALRGDRAAPRPTPLDALRLARQKWLTGARIDMGGLAQELGISRATLYTWVGSKDKLLGEVLWSFAQEGLRQATAAAEGTGGDYILDVFGRFSRMNAGFEPLHRFLEQEPELGLRLLTSKHGPVEGRMIDATRKLLTDQIEAGALTLALDVDTLSYLIIRIAESVIYIEWIAGGEADVDRAVEVVRILLNAPADSGARGGREAGSG